MEKGLEKKELALLTRLHDTLKPLIYIISALLFGVAGAYLVVSIVALLQDATQPGWLIAIFQWSAILLITYWIMRIAILAGQSFGKHDE